MSGPEQRTTPRPEIPDFKRHELIPAIVQDASSGRVLMLGYMNREAYERTRTEGVAWFWSRSRQRLWMKGETSGNVLRVRAIRADCDGDTLLVLADPAGPTCHTGAPGCFYNLIAGETAPAGCEIASDLFQTIRGRLAERPEGSYVARLAEGGLDRMAKKVGEEATEVVIAAKNRDRDELTREMADLWFHTFVLLAEAGLSPSDIWAELARRRR